MKRKIITGLAFCLIVGFVIGFFVGRSSIKTKTITKLIEGERVFGSAIPNDLQPVKVEKPEQSVLPVKTDTIVVEEIRVIIQKVDTAQILADYELKRTYNVTAFDNKEYGRLDLYPTVQYNRLSALDYAFIPILKETTIYRERTLKPFVSGNYSTFQYWGVGGGVFYHNLGVEYQYQRDFISNSNGHSFGLKYSF